MYVALIRKLLIWTCLQEGKYHKTLPVDFQFVVSSFTQIFSQHLSYPNHMLYLGFAWFPMLSRKAKPVGCLMLAKQLCFWN